MDKIENMGTNEANGTNETKKTTFTSLTPDILEENKQVYTNALEFAFKKDDIRNIAITGVYGAGKSTVWNTYREYKAKKLGESSFENIITVCLGKYEDNSKAIVGDNSTKDDPKNSKTNREGKELDNRVERQIINQISAQIKQSDIPLSKYKLKGNISKRSLWGNTLLTVLFSISIFLLIYLKPIFKYLRDLSDDFVAITILGVLFTTLFIAPVGFYLFNFYKENKIKFSKVSFKGAEAQFTEINNDETVLERDMKEIVYLLSSSGAEIVVFEDLDRYDSIDIFVKLKELNFLLNSYIETIEKDKVVRFVYLIKDSLFYSKDRTKFFDFIIPIVPVVDSKSSEDYLIDLLGMKDEENNSNEDKSGASNENKLSKSILRNISLYIDDMRILRNIVNEYKVYSEVLPTSDILLNENMLFSLVTVKNLYPNEFDLLQKDKGYIIDIFKKIKDSCNQIVEKLQAEYHQIISNIDKLETQIENDKFEIYALHIPSDLRVMNGDSRKWTEFLREWSNNPDKYYHMFSSSINTSYRYEEFLNKIISLDEEKQEMVNLWGESKREKLEELREEKINLNQKIEQAKLYNPKELLSVMNPKKIDEIFACSNDIENQEFPLIRYLIIEGLLDETYWYYKGSFDINDSKTLKKNDRIFMKGLLGKTDMNVFLPIESPNEILNRLIPEDYNRFNILNFKLLKTCCEEKRDDKIISILNAVDQYEKYEEMVRILEKTDREMTRYVVGILYSINIDMITRMLEINCDKDGQPLFEVLLPLILNRSREVEKFEKVRKYIENNAKVIESVPEELFDEFIEKLQSKNIKFEDLRKLEISKEKLKRIEEITAYRLSVVNLIFLTEKILDKKIEYGNLLNEIYGSIELVASKKYIEGDFENIISEYIENHVTNRSFINHRDILAKILSSNLSYENKIKYLSKNTEAVFSLKESEITDINIVHELFKRDKVTYTHDNLNYYWDLINNNDDDEQKEKDIECFIRNMNDKIPDGPGQSQYVDNKGIHSELSKCVSICNELINISIISDDLFKIIINHAERPIDQLNSKLDKDRIKALITKNMISPNEENIKMVIEKLLDEEVKTVAEMNEKEVLPILRNMELSDETIDSIVNANISTENAKSLLTKLKESEK